MQPQQPISIPRIVTVASIGGGLEMYDFVIYVFFASIISQLFFSTQDSYLALIETFLVFALGYFARPLGAIIFGHYGDRIGRRGGLLVTILLMAVACLGITFLPTFHSIGIAATILFIFFRLVQGIAVGGDLPGAITFVAEYAANHNRGFLCSLIYLGVNLGILLASFVAMLIHEHLHPEEVISWGWRLAFLLGAFIAVLGYYIRKKVMDTPYFTQMKLGKSRIAKFPIATLFRHNTKNVLQGICLSWLFAVIIAQIFLYMPVYLKTVVQWEASKALELNTINLLIFSALIPLFGYVADKIGHKKLLLGVSFLFIALSYWLYGLLNQPEFSQQITALIILGILSAGFVGVAPSVLAELFPTPTRYTGVGFSYNVGFAIFAGLTPAFATYLLHEFNNPQAASYNLILAAVVCFIAVLTMKEQTNQPLSNV